MRVQNYGGGLWYTWFDRDLGVAGRVLVNRKDEAGTDVPRHELVRVDRPVMRISSLAIHLDRSLNDGFKVNFQSHMAPIIADEVQRALGGAQLGETKERQATLPRASGVARGCAQVRPGGYPGFRVPAVRHAAERHGGARATSTCFPGGSITCRAATRLCAR